VIIFDTDDETSVGWLVDYTYRVRDFENAEIEPVEDNRYIEGILKGNDGFTLWVNPDRVNSQVI